MKNTIKKRLSLLSSFIRLESFSGILLCLATAFALIAANSPLASLYYESIHAEIGILLGTFKVATSFGHFVNDGLMAIFFFVVGLELKREFQDGALSLPSQRLLPCVTAVFGVLVPAAIFLSFNFNSDASQGWAIPCATDIAFSLAVLTLVKVPLPLKIFLSTLAIVDDLIAILIIAFFYSSTLNITSLFLVGVIFFLLLIFSQLRIHAQTLYLLFGIILWSFLLSSGIHPTLAGVLLSITIPRSMIEELENMLHSWVAYLILPLFAFCNAGLPLHELSVSMLTEPISMGIILGLLLGKPLGIFGSALLLKRFFSVHFDDEITLRHILGASILAGIGFTMSIFISGLAFSNELFVTESRISILVASCAASVIGYFVLKNSSSPSRK